MTVAGIPAEVAAELARLRAENTRLPRLLKLTPQQAAPPGPAQAGLFEAPPGPAHNGSPPPTDAARTRPALRPGAPGQPPGDSQRSGE